MTNPVGAVWKALEVSVPADLTGVEVGRFLEAEVWMAAHRADKSVRDVRVGVGGLPRGEWRTWSASYLPGDPRA
ncbi:MAG: hypothetical protein JWR34_6476 [Mycobacterium sp.]|jgi:hypothetical protein|nr:hypothetical protein [Mycobacterium sp.]